MRLHYIKIFCMVSSDDPFTKTMNLLRLSGANEPQSGVGPKFIFCVGRGPGSKAVVVVSRDAISSVSGILPSGNS